MLSFTNRFPSIGASEMQFAPPLLITSGHNNESSLTAALGKERNKMFLSELKVILVVTRWQPVYSRRATNVPGVVPNSLTEIHLLWCVVKERSCHLNGEVAAVPGGGGEKEKG